MANSNRPKSKERCRYDDWPDRWERLTGKRPDVMLSDTSPRGAPQYMFVVDGKPTPTATIHAGLPKSTNRIRNIG